MNLYISLKWLEEHIEVVSYEGMWHETETDEFVSVKNIHSAPSIDIVRCAECVYCNIKNTKYLYAICERHGIEFKPFEDDTRTHGCAWGERKESE